MDCTSSAERLSTCPGVNLPLTMWALCYRAAERLVSAFDKADEQ